MGGRVNTAYKPRHVITSTLAEQSTTQQTVITTATQSSSLIAVAKVNMQN